MTLDNIEASADTTMTAELLRLFKAAGCSPTVCHACQKPIKAGDIFKLVPHKKKGNGPLIDEMCCAKCSAPELVKRDKAKKSRPSRYDIPRTITDPVQLEFINKSVAQRQGEWAGYSRVSKAKP